MLLTLWDHFVTNEGHAIERLIKQILSLLASDSELYHREVEKKIILHNIYNILYTKLIYF